MSKQILLLLFIAAFASAQEGVPAPSTAVIGAQYPRILPDNSVIFRIKADSAHKVTIGGYALTKSDDGFWTVRTKPYAPGFHYYSPVVVDGFATTDPGSQTFFGGLRQSSGIEIPGPDSDFFSDQVQESPPHGAMRIEWYFSKSTNKWRRIFVYTPPDYDKSLVRAFRFSICSTVWARTKADGAIKGTRISSSIT